LSQKSLAYCAIGDLKGIIINFRNLSEISLEEIIYSEEEPHSSDCARTVTFMKKGKVALISVSDNLAPQGIFLPFSWLTPPKKILDF